LVVAGVRFRRGQLAEPPVVDGDGGVHVLEVGLGLSPVAAVADAVAAGEFAGGALGAGPDGVPLVAGGVLPAGAGAGLQSGRFARGEADGALAVAGGGAPGPQRAGLALAFGECGHDERGRAGRGGRAGAVPSRAGLALRAGDFPAVEVGAEVVAGGAVLVAVLAGAVAGQRPGERGSQSRLRCRRWRRAWRRRR
jgi:hypothetical protein